jgi:hypothetical protein
VEGSKGKVTANKEDEREKNSLIVHAFCSFSARTAAAIPVLAKG